MRIIARVITVISISFLLVQIPTDIYCAEEDLSALPARELENRLTAVDKEIGELEVEADYLRTEPPDFSVDSAEIERTGFGSAGQVKSKLLNPRADYETTKRLRELRHLKERIEKELDKRDAK